MIENVAKSEACVHFEARQYFIMKGHNFHTQTKVAILSLADCP
jgi:hypothetical protein